MIIGEMPLPEGTFGIDVGLRHFHIGAFAAAVRAGLPLLPVAIPTIERVGGGGVRCMLAEIHLPKRAPVASAVLKS